MHEKSRPKDGEKGALGRKDGEPAFRRREDPGFDRWLNRQLHRLYDPVLNEETPEAFDDILAKFESREDKSKKSAPDESASWPSRSGSSTDDDTR